jgi:hypothetical protein
LEEQKEMKRDRKSRTAKVADGKTAIGRMKNQATLVFVLSIFATWGSMFYWRGGYLFPGQHGPVLRWHGWPLSFMGCTVEGVTECTMYRWLLVQNFASWMGILAVVSLVGFGIVLTIQKIVGRIRHPLPVMEQELELEPALEV